MIENKRTIYFIKSFRKHNRLNRKDRNGVRSLPQGIARCVLVTYHYGRLETSCQLIRTAILIMNVKSQQIVTERSAKGFCYQSNHLRPN